MATLLLFNLFLLEPSSVAIHIRLIDKVSWAWLNIPRPVASLSIKWPVKAAELVTRLIKFLACFLAAFFGFLAFLAAGFFAFFTFFAFLGFFASFGLSFFGFSAFFGLTTLTSL